MGSPEMLEYVLKPNGGHPLKRKGANLIHLHTT